MTRLAPEDYYYVRFVKPADPDTGVVAGYEGVVIEHCEHEGQVRAVVEVAPWDECGEPLVIVAVPLDHLERLELTVEAAQFLLINQRWEDMERWLNTRLHKKEKTT